MEYMTCEELERLAKEYGISTSPNEWVDLYYIEQALLRKFIEKSRDEREKLPHRGYKKNTGNIERFADFLKHKIGEEMVCEIRFDDNVEVDIDDLEIDIYDDHIEVGRPWGMYIGLHSDYYNEIFDFLFDEYSVFRLLRYQYNRLEMCIKHIRDIKHKMYDSNMLQLALTDSSKYEGIKNRYETLHEEIKPFFKFGSEYEWEEALMAFVVKGAKRNIEDIAKKAVGKTLKACEKKRDSYNISRDILLGAFSHGLVKEEDCPKPWDEFINAIVGEHSAEKVRKAYLDNVAKAFKDKMEVCVQRNTTFMLNKKKKMETDLALCQQLKEKYGVDCFIDRSVFSPSVTHMNVVLRGNQVLVFRMDKRTPLLKECVGYMRIAQSLDRIISVTQKPVKLCKYVSKDPTNLTNRDTTEMGKKLSKILKFVKGGLLEITVQNAKLTVFLGSMGCEISIRKKTATEDFKKIVAPLKMLIKAVETDHWFEIKGIYTERMPHL